MMLICRVGFYWGKGEGASQVTLMFLSASTSSMQVWNLEFPGKRDNSPLRQGRR